MDGNDVTNLLLPPLCLPVDTGGKLGCKTLCIVIQLGCKALCIVIQLGCKALCIVIQLGCKALCIVIQS